MAGAYTWLTDPPPYQPGNRVTSSAFTINVNPGGRVATRTSSILDPNPPYAYQGTLTAAMACIGDNPAGLDNSPRSRLVVTGPTGGVVLDQTSPVKNTSLWGMVDGTWDTPMSPQPAPGNGNYRGGPWSTVINLAGKPAGTYTIQTFITNKVQSTGNESLPCTTGTATGATGVNAYRPGVVVETTTFIYQPS